MQWSDATRPPSRRHLRQFAGIWLVVFGTIAAWRAWHGTTGLVTSIIAVAAVVVGLAGLVSPPLVRVIYTTWMMTAFPIGWFVSRVALAIVFYLLFTPIALMFRLIGRDALRRRRPRAESYWLPYDDARKPDEYFRQY